jgi:hypothetical protein
MLAVVVPYSALVGVMGSQPRSSVLGWLVGGGDPTSVAVATARSLFSPEVLGAAGLGLHGVVVLGASLLLGLYLLMAGGAIEGVLGRGGFALAYLLGGVLAGVLVLLPWVEATGAFWLGHGGFMVLLGAALVGLLLAGNVVPALLATALAALLVWTQGLGWLPSDIPVVGREVRPGPIHPATWSFALLVAGAALGWVLARRNEQLP